MFRYLRVKLLANLFCPGNGSRGHGLNRLEYLSRSGSSRVSLRVSFSEAVSLTEDDEDGGSAW